MSIFIISNREVNEQGTKFLDNKEGNKAMPTFRIARCEKLKDNYSYEILEDQYAPNYVEVLKDFFSDEKKIDERGTNNLFLTLYDKMLQEETKGDLLIFIHGFNISIKKHLKTNLDTLTKHSSCQDSKIKHLIYISWPSRGKIGINAYNDDENNAVITGWVSARFYLQFINFLKILKYQEARYCGRNIHLMVHSMGNQVMESFLNTIRKRDLFPIFKEVILLNADVENTVFEEGEPFTKLYHLADRTSIYTHKTDKALILSSTIVNIRDFSERLGRKGPSKNTKLNQETFSIETSEAKADRFFNDAIPENAQITDHWGYIYYPEVINDIKAVLNGEKSDSIPHRKQSKTNPNYYTIQNQ